MAPTADRADDVERFGRWASTYDRSPLQRLVFEPVHRATLDAVRASGARPRRILDVGCGTGQGLTTIERRVVPRMAGSVQLVLSGAADAP